MIKWFVNRTRYFISSIKLAWKGTSFRFGVILCTIGIVFGLVAGVGMTNLCLLVAIALLGWGLEVANTSIETLMDIVHPKYSPKVKIVKDAFGAVPFFVYSAYVICWLILVAPTLVHKIFGG